MGRRPCFSKEGLNRGAWTSLEDKILIDYIKLHGVGKWRNLPIKAGLKRCGKSCRLRWLNYLRPGIIRGNISPQEEELIIRLHKLLGNRWSLIAGRLPGRTDNEIKNYWNTKLRKRVKQVQKRSPKRSYGTKRNCDLLGTGTSTDPNRIDDNNNNKAKVIDSHVIRPTAFKVSPRVNFLVDAPPPEMHMSSNADRKVTLTPFIDNRNEEDDRLRSDQIFMNNDALGLGDGENEKDDHPTANASVLDSDIRLSELLDFEDFSTELYYFNNYENNLHGCNELSISTGEARGSEQGQMVQDLTVNDFLESGGNWLEEFEFGEYLV